MIIKVSNQDGLSPSKTRVVPPSLETGFVAGSSAVGLITHWSGCEVTEGLQLPTCSHISIYSQKRKWKQFRFLSRCRAYFACYLKTFSICISVCSCGRFSIPGSGKSPGEGDGNPLQYSCLEVPKSSDRTKGLSTHSKELGFSGGSVVKNPPANAGDVGLFPGPGRSLEKGNS